MGRGGLGFNHQDAILRTCCNLRTIWRLGVPTEMPGPQLHELQGFSCLLADPMQLDPLFCLGAALWAAGLAINIHADLTLRQLRQDKRTGVACRASLISRVLQTLAIQTDKKAWAVIL